MDNETFLGYTLSRTNMLETRTRVDNLGSERHCNPVIFLNRVIPFLFWNEKLTRTFNVKMSAAKVVSFCSCL